MEPGGILSASSAAASASSSPGRRARVRALPAAETPSGNGRALGTHKHVDRPHLWAHHGVRSQASTSGCISDRSGSKSEGQALSFGVASGIFCLAGSHLPRARLGPFLLGRQPHSLGSPRAPLLIGRQPPLSSSPRALSARPAAANLRGLCRLASTNARHDEPMSCCIAMPIASEYSDAYRFLVHEEYSDANRFRGQRCQSLQVRAMPIASEYIDAFFASIHIFALLV